MSNHLKPNEKVFIDEYLSNGNNAHQAAKKAWPDITPESASVKAHRLLSTDKVKKLLDKKIGITDEDLIEAHKRLLNHKRVEYFVFPKKMEDEEIIDKVNAAGFDVIVIKDGEKGKYAFYSSHDPVAVSKALDMGFKIKGTYAPEKKEITVLETENELTDEDRELLEVMRSHGRNTGTKAS